MGRFEMVEGPIREFYQNIYVPLQLYDVDNNFSQYVLGIFG